jgi:DNA segregation ATPase FtsK/SpoIIIE, S-DNA-T family
MKRGFARSTPAEAPGFAPAPIELPTPLKVPPPEGKPLWTVVLVIGLIGLVGGMVWVSFASGARSFTGAGSFFPIMMVGGLLVMLFSGRGSREMSRSTLDALRARFLLVLDELRGTTSELADRLDANYRWYHPAPATLEASLGSVRMWERKADGSDVWFGVARVGVGMTDLVEAQAAVFAEPADMPTDIELEPVTGKVLQEFVRYQTVAYGMPALVSLMVEPGYELRGPRERVLGLMRSIICQLAFFHGPDHLRIVVVTSDVAEWDWVKWLPHVGDSEVADGAGPVRMVYGSVADFLGAQQDGLFGRGRGEFRGRHGAAKDPIQPLPHTVIVCDCQDGWDWLGDRAGVSGLTFFDVRGWGRVPPCDEPKRVLHIGGDAVVAAVPRDPVTWDAKPAEAPRFFAIADQTSREEAEAFAERMSRWRLAEAYEAVDLGVGARLMARDILSYYGIDDAASIDFDKLWGPRSDINSLQRLRVPIGNRADNKELFFLDLKEQSQDGCGPHGVMAGTTGSGKTTMLRALIEALMLGHPPQNLQFMLADLKGGSGVKPFTGVPHVAHVITDLEDDQSLLGRFVDALNGEIARRKALCARAGVDDATEYNKKRADEVAAGKADVLPPMPVLVVVIDEFAELFRMMAGDIERALDQICRQGRAYWIHLLMASQQIDNRAEKLLENMGYRLALQTRTSAAAMAIGVPNAVNLKGSGSCYFLEGTPSSANLTKFQGEFLWREYRKPGTEDFDAGTDGAGMSVNYFPPQLFTTEFTPLPLPEDARGDAEEVAATSNGEAPAVEPPVDEEEGDTALMRPVVGRIIIEQLRRINFEPYRLWQPPLDAPWSIEKLVNTHLGRPWDGGYARTPNLVFPIGLVDRPFKHDQHPLALDVSGPGANVLIVGAQGSGKTTALQDLICAAAMTHTPEQVQFYCLAFSSAALSSVAGLPHVGGVAQQLDSDGVRRTVAEMRELLTRRKRSFEEAGVMSMEVFRRRKFGGEPGAVPDDGHGDVFLVVDNYAGVASEYEVLLDQIDRLIKEGPTFGIHVVAAVSKTSELRPQVRGQFGVGSRVELRLGDPTDADLVKASMAKDVPAGRAGRGMIAQNYERAGEDPVGLHTLMARPAMQATDEHVFDSRSVVDAVRGLAGGFSPAVRVRRLPKRVLPGELARLAAAPPARESALVWALSETEEPVFFDGQHLLVAGQRKCGRSTVCATVMAEIARVYAPGAQAGAGQPGRHGAAGRRAAQVWLVDPRRLLLDVLGPQYVHRFASTAATVKQRMVELAAVLAARQPDDDPSGSRRMQRRWEGPEIFLVIDDAQRLPAGFDSPLEPIAQFVESGADVGLHIIYTRLFGGFSSSVGADPVMRMLRQANAPLLVMDSDPDEGFIRGKWKGHSMPRGRGFLLNTTESGIYVQVADAQLPETDQP